MWRDVDPRAQERERPEAGLGRVGGYTEMESGQVSDDPRDVDNMVRLVRAGADVVAGSRYCRGGRQKGGPFLKRLLSQTAGASLHWLAGLPIQDATNNFRAYSRRLIEEIPIEGTSSFALALELTLKAHWRGWRVAEVPTTWQDRTAGQSRFKLLAWAPHYLRWYLRAIVVAWFVGTVIAMSMREHIGVQLGFIALTGAISLVLVLALLGDRVKAASFEHCLQELDWRAIFFYIALFALVGGLEKSHILDKLANALKPIFIDNYAMGATLLYWVTVPIVGLVEHDAYILTFLHTIKDMAQGGIEPWPLWWMLLWSGTLGSNLTVAGAPALYVALTLGEKEEGRKVSLR